MNNLDAQNAFITLATKKEELVKELKSLNEQLEPIMAELGEDAIFQADNGIVYKIKKWTGQFVTAKDLDYVRTRSTDFGDPKSGGVFLSKKEATEKGFAL